MNLDNYRDFAELDPQNMLAEIDGLPGQLEKAWSLGKRMPLSEKGTIRQVLIAGMGGSAIGADLMSAYAAPLCKVPIVVNRNYDLPAWAQGPETLVIASSHSGNTEETLSTFEQAVEKQCKLIAVTTGGKLAEEAERAKADVWRFEHKGQPRAAVGYSFGLLLSIVARLDLLPDPTEELAGAIQAMREQQKRLRAEVLSFNNPAKRTAGQLVGRWVAVIGSDFLEPVARRWKGQFSEIGKAWAQFEFLPEADHNTLAGVLNPEDVLTNTMVLFLRGKNIHPRNRLRTELTKKIFMLEALGTDFVDAQGDTRLAEQWTALHFGDYAAYYLAMSYDIDPTPVAAIETFKAEMESADQSG